MTFEEKLAKLEALTKKMESGELKLDEMLKAFEEGRALAEYCQKDLEVLRVKIEKITGEDTVEPLVFTDLDEDKKGGAE